MMKSLARMLADCIGKCTPLDEEEKVVVADGGWAFLDMSIFLDLKFSKRS